MHLSDKYILWVEVSGTRITIMKWQSMGKIVVVMREHVKRLYTENEKNGCYCWQLINVVYFINHQINLTIDIGRWRNSGSSGSEWQKWWGDRGVQPPTLPFPWIHARSHLRREAHLNTVAASGVEVEIQHQKDPQTYTILVSDPRHLETCKSHQNSWLWSIRHWLDWLSCEV